MLDKPDSAAPHEEWTSCQDETEEHEQSMKMMEQIVIGKQNPAEK